MNPIRQMLLAVPAVALASVAAHLVFWLINRLIFGMTDGLESWWRGEGLIALMAGFVVGLIAYVMLVLSDDRLSNDNIIVRSAQGFAFGGCVGLVPAAILVSVRLLADFQAGGGSTTPFSMLALILVFAVYPALSGLLWAVISWFPPPTVPGSTIDNA